MMKSSLEIGDGGRGSGRGEGESQIFDEYILRKQGATTGGALLGTRRSGKERRKRSRRLETGSG